MGSVEHVRLLNGAVLQLHAKWQSAHAGGRWNTSNTEQRNFRTEAASVLQERAAAFSELIEREPEQALALAFSPELLDMLTAAFPESAHLLESVGTWRGSLEHVVIDDANLNEVRSVRQLHSGNDSLEVFLAGPQTEKMASGDMVQASGVRSGSRMAASSLSVISRASTAAVSSTGSQSVAVILVTFPGVTPPLPVQSAYNVFFDTAGRSLSGYWRDTSYGLTSATGSVFGWYTLSTTYTCDQYPSIRTAAIAAADRDVYFPNYTRLFIVFPKPAGCSYSGMATIGSTSLSSSDGTFTASTAWLIADYMSPNDQGVEMAAHEGGHGLGLYHSRSRDFGTYALGALGAAGTINEYGDSFSPMGYFNLGHYTAEQMNSIGWLPSANILTVQSSGTFSVAPLEQRTTMPQVLKVQRGTGNPDWLWIEYRQPVGNYESTLPSQIFSGATVRYVDSNTGSYTDLLDYTPNTSSWTDPALAVGQTWTDPYSNLSLYVSSATSSALQVKVSYGSAPCALSSPSVVLTPADPSVGAGNSVSYNATITNNNSSSCGSTTFNLTSTQPSGWTSGLSAGSITLSPGQSVSSLLTETPPLATTPGTYGISLTAAASTEKATGQAYCSVTTTLPSLSVTVAVGGTSYARKSTVPITATVLSGSLHVSGAGVQFVIKNPKGSTTSFTATTNTTGQASVSYKLPPNAALGTYQVTATASYGGQTAVSSTVTFSVK